MPKAKVGDINIYYEVHGEGEPLVLIMGASGTTAWWGPQIPLLSQEYKVVVFDNRGIGHSDAPDFPYTTKMMADDTVGLMDALGIDSAHIFGFSMGGLIAQELALNYPQRVVSLVLAGTGYGGSVLPEEARTLSRQAAAMPLEDIVHMMPPMVFTMEYVEGNPKAIEEFIVRVLEKPAPPHGRLHQTEAVDAHDTYDRLPHIKAPTLVIGGEKDGLVAIEHQKEFASRLENAEFVELEGCGHLFFLQKPEEVSKFVLDFLRRHPKK